MESAQFVKDCALVAKFITDYMEAQSGEAADVTCTVDPGFLKPHLDKTIPEKGLPFAQVLDEMKTVVMPGLMHWAHPHFHGYLPSSHAYPSILAEMFASCSGAMGFSWIASPVMAELEVVMTDWLGYALGLPDAFLHRNTSNRGGGIMASSATECALTTLMAARLNAVNRLKAKDATESEKSSSASEVTEAADSIYLQHLVAYCSNEAHSSIEKAANVAMIRLRVLEANANQQLDPETLKSAMACDVREGRTPCYVVVTLGTTSSGAFDDLEEISKVVKSFPDVWLHVNGAYGGNNFICPELRRHLNGIEDADSFCVNPYKGLLMNMDSTVLWVKDRIAYCAALIVDPVYLQHNLSDRFLDHRHWSLWLSRRFRSLKIWFTFRLYGVYGLREHMRNMMNMAHAFADLVRSDDRFEVCNEVSTPLVCFRLQGPDGLNHELLALVNGRNRMLMTPALLGGRFVLRFVVGYEGTTMAHMTEAWAEIKLVAGDLLLGIELPMDESLFRRLNFTRRVSFMDFGIRNPSLTLRSVADPILLPIITPEPPLDDDNATTLSLTTRV